MKVRMITTAMGPKVALKAGNVYDLEPGFARSLVAGGYAREVEKPVEKPVEKSVEETTAAEPVDEITAKPEPKPRAVKRGTRGRVKK